MLNIGKVEHIYLAVGTTDLRKSIDGLSVIVHSGFGMEIDEQSVFVFCNRSRDKLKVLHWDNGFWLYYYRLEKGKLKWPMDEKLPAVNIDLAEFKWLLKGYEIRNNHKLVCKKPSNLV